MDWRGGGVAPKRKCPEPGSASSSAAAIWEASKSEWPWKGRTNGREKEVSGRDRTVKSAFAGVRRSTTRLDRSPVAYSAASALPEVATVGWRRSSPLWILRFNLCMCLCLKESALLSADLEEEIHQKQGQKRKKSQSGVKGADRKVLDVDDTVVSQRRKIQINQEEERLKNERTVFVGNLPVTCDKKKLKSFFKEYGPIESVRFRSLIPAEGTLSKKLAAIKRKIHPDQKNINAYVVFKDESAATQALKRNGAQIADGFRVRVDLASETSSRDKRSVFVGNLPYIEESAVEKHFLDCGSIMAVRIVRDQVTGVGKGFGYVLFEHTDSVHLALKLNNSELMGRKLRVMRSVNKEKLKQQNSNPRLKNVSKPKQGLNLTSKNAEGHSKSLFIGEKAVLIKKKKKGQKKSRCTKKQRKQK
nr:RNA-binding protein 34 isoform X4 [Saimiri boliviensis boliviensis]